MAQGGGVAAVAVAGKQSTRNVADWFCILGGLFLLGRGVAGVFIDPSFGFPGEGWQTLIHLLSGMALLAAAAGKLPATRAALALGVLYLALTAVGVVDGKDVLGIFEADASDKLIHGVLGGASLVTGLLSLDTRPQDVPPQFRL